MVDAIYSTVIELSAEGDLGAKMDGLMGGLGDLSSSFSDFGENASDIFTGLIEKAGGLVYHFGKLAAIGVGGALTYGVASLNAGLEKTQMSLASLFNVNGAASGMNEGMELAASQMATMRKDAASLPGSFDALVGIFKGASVQGFRAGMNVDQIRSMSENAMAAAASGGLDLNVAGRQLGQLIAGKAGGRNKLGMALALDEKTFNALTQDDRIKMLNERLGKFGEARALFTTSWAGITTTLVDNAKQILGAATLPLFNSVKTALGEVNGYFDANHDKITFWAGYAGQIIHNSFEKGLSFLSYWWPAMINFAESFEQHFLGVWHQVEPIVGRIGGMVEKIVTDPEKTWGKLAEMGKVYGALKITGAIAPGVSGLVSKLGGGAGGAAEIAEMGAAAAPAALAIAALAASVYGVIDILSDVNNPLHDFGVDTVKSIKENLGELGENVKTTGGDLWTAARPIVDLMGADLLWSIQLTTTTLNFAIEAIQSFYVALAFVGGEIANLFKSDGPKLGGDVADKIERGMDEPATAWNTATTALNNLTTAQKKQQTPQGHGTHIDKVEITVSGQTDPSRVARIVSNHLTEMARNPRASRFATNYSGSR